MQNNENAIDLTTPFVSVLYVVRNKIEWFSKSIDSIIATADKKDIEVLLKVDSDDNPSSYIKCLRKSGLSYKVLVYDQMAGYHQVTMFFLELCKIAVGEFVSIFSDDTIMLTSNWVSELKRAYGFFEDHIMVCAFQKQRINKYGRDYSRVCSKCPIISRRWLQCGEYLSPKMVNFFCDVVPMDKYLYVMGQKMKRYIYLKEVKINMNASKVHGVSHLAKPLSSPLWKDNLEDHIRLLESYMINQKIDLPEGIEFTCHVGSSQKNYETT